MYIPINTTEPNLTGILALAAVTFDVTPNEIASRSRRRNLVRARQAYCYVSRLYIYGSSLKDIGALINRDHTTVIHSIDKAGIMLKYDSAFYARVTDMQKTEDNKTAVYELEVREVKGGYWQGRVYHGGRCLAYTQEASKEKTIREITVQMQRRSLSGRLKLTKWKDH